MEVEGEERIETAVALDFTARTPESPSAMAVGTPTPTPISIYSSVLSYIQAPTINTPTEGTITNSNDYFPNPAILFYAFWEGLHPSSIAQQALSNNRR